MCGLFPTPLRFRKSKPHAMKPSLLALAFLTGLIAGSPLRAELPAEQKKVLDQLRGKWRIEGTVHKSEAAPGERKLTDTDTAEWTLGGSYLESRGEDSMVIRLLDNLPGKGVREVLLSKSRSC